MITRVILGLAVVALAVTAVPVVAHHAFSAEFDADRPLQLTGTVTRVEWINPHAWIHIETAEGENWMIEGGTPNTLFRRGFTKELAAGRHRDRGGRLPGEGRHEQGERPRPDVHGRPQAVHGFVRHGRPARRPRRDRAVTAAVYRFGRFESPGRPLRRPGLFVCVRCLLERRQRRSDLGCLGWSTPLDSAHRMYPERSRQPPGSLAKGRFTSRHHGRVTGGGGSSEAPRLPLARRWPPAAGVSIGRAANSSRYPACWDALPVQAAAAAPPHAGRGSREEKSGVARTRATPLG